MDLYNKKRLHSTMDYKTPNEVYYQAVNNLNSKGEKLLQKVSLVGGIKKSDLVVLKKECIIVFYYSFPFYLQHKKLLHYSILNIFLSHSVYIHL